MLSTAGALIVGRAAMDEFAMGSRTPNVTNPSNPNCYAGGSSGGTASSVASGIVSFGLCSDTGGSTRIPASYCQIAGFRPTTNLVTRHGLTELSSNMDSVGIMTRKVEQIIPILRVLTQYDPKDMAQSTHNRMKLLFNDSTFVDSSQYIPPKNIILNIANDLSHCTTQQIDLFKSYHSRILNPIKQILASQNIITNDIQLPNNNDIIKTYYIYVCAQTRTNLARFRGERYNLNDAMDIATSDLLGKEPKYRYRLGELLLKSSDPDTLFNNLKRKLELWSKYILGDNTYLLLPTHVEDTPIKTQLADNESVIDESYVILSSILGLPSVTVPIIHSHINGGKASSFQLVGPKYSDFDLLKIATYLEKLISNSK
ncbi:Amidase [Babesia microti strain RI]|uniref:Amidase n=1 Tax=Babesia microti (strain RI) TaxID=1133968 RepID=A0A1N6LWQ6_BABMR|nr:Amidase [Babesia microti strain RI]SIO73296.1 Amidase [Babesia microti strain RI]|eukprot:XP_012647386.2 Amidase [Babesia microti strain RI]